MSEPSADGAGRPIVVLHAIKPPQADTTYATQMLESAPAGVEVRFFDWRSALHDRYDVLHIHWPEFLIRGTGKRDKLRALIAVPRLVRKLRRERIAVVRTLHNLRPHEGGHPLERLLERMLDRAVHVSIALNPATEAEGPEPVLIRHGDYIEQFAAHPRSERVPGRILYFGLVRPYKGIDALVDAFVALDDPELSLRIVGRPNSAAFRRAIEQQVHGHERISTRFEFVADRDLVAELSAAELVVLPYREMHNSGSLLVALSLGRPVVTLDTPSNRAILDEIGEGWLHLFEGELTPERIAEALAAVRDRDPGDDGVPTFDGRDWPTVGRRHRDAYDLAIARARSSA